MREIAERLGVSVRCLYDVLQELNHRHPDTAWFRKVGRFRRFTEGDYRQLVEALKWRSSRADRAPAKQILMCAVRGLRTRGTKKPTNGLSARTQNRKALAAVRPPTPAARGAGHRQAMTRSLI